MKTTVLTIAAIFASLNIFAQGTVAFSNIGLNAPVLLGVPYSLVTPSNTVIIAAGAKAPGGTFGTGGPQITAFSVALYYAPYNGGTPPDPASLFQIGEVIGQPLSAYLSKAGTYFVRTAYVAPTPITVPPGGGLGWFQVKAWESLYGMTYEQAAQNPLALTGVSSIIAV